LAAECSVLTFEPGQLIVKEQDWGQHMVAITSGKANVVRGDRQLATVGTGDVVGEMSLIDGERRSASVVADGPVEGLVIYGTRFRKLLAEHPTMVMNLLLAQTARLRALDKQLARFG
jgi:CRP/FNR family transcriptional regulator, cyclic AMP receptor protein